MPTRILIVDDHPLFRDGLRALLRQQADFLLVGEADTVAAAVRLAQETQPDVALMDLSLPDGDGVTATCQILAAQPQIHVIALTVHDEPELLAAMARAGAAGYILKETRSADLIRAVRTVATTGVALSPAMLPDLFRQYRGVARPPAAGAPRLA
jgi:DNA-binding NarL/FixJ family response regulator